MSQYINKKVCWGVVLILLVLSVGGVTVYVLSNNKQKPIAHETLKAEKFIKKNLQTKEGLIRTNLTSQQDVFLSETVGLWMEYLVEKNDILQFDKQVEVLQKYFLTDDDLVIWELKGDKEAPANALIDDLRIIDALFKAGKQWNEKEYTDLASKMSEQLVTYQTRSNLMVDFIDLHEKTKGKDLTLSYIIPSGFDQMKGAGLLPKEIYQETKSMFLNAPTTELGFFPKKFHIPTGEYIYEEKINLIDQLYTGYHLAQWGGDVSSLLTFTKTAFSQGGGKIYGQYDGDTGKPIVQYEAPAVYALATLLCLEVGEDEFAKKLYERMKKMQYNNSDLPYDGGYIDIRTKETHTFDNLLALLVERRVLDEEAFRK
ncbi:hypothetical protein [Bacillus sp. JJ722]|uniref:hypothetical protein n=1 Tax=Bacillus sp. JJ722 TaxID=3122973 RepID=UPI002FFDE70A